MEPADLTFSPLPPWEQYPAADPYWVGWRQGRSEEWLHTVWLPFWGPLSEQEKLDYLDRHPAPDAAWRTQLLEFWGVPRKG